MKIQVMLQGNDLIEDYMKMKRHQSRLTEYERYITGLKLASNLIMA